MSSERARRRAADSGEPVDEVRAGDRGSRQAGSAAGGQPAAPGRRGRSNIDTTDLTPDEVVEEIAKLARRAGCRLMEGRCEQSPIGARAAASPGRGGGRLPERREEHARQPAGGRPRGGHRCGARCDPGPAGARMRVERAQVRPDRHRRRRPGRLRRAREGGPGAGPSGDRGRRGDPARRRRAQRPRPRRRRARRPAAPLESPGDRGGQQDRSAGGRGRWRPS